MKLKKPTSLFKCWLRNRNFTQNTLDTRCQIKSPMWPNRTWCLGGVNRTDPQIAKYDLPQIICTIYPPLKSSNFEQNFKRTQHHALLHKGLFCERPIRSLCIVYFSLHNKRLMSQYKWPIWSLACLFFLNTWLNVFLGGLSLHLNHLIA